MTTELATFQALMIAAARSPRDLATLAFAGVIAMRSRRKVPYDVPIAGLDSSQLQSLKEQFFPDSHVAFFDGISEKADRDHVDEFEDLVAMLVDNATHDNEETKWVAHAVATASMAKNHLWEDMGLPSRVVLSELLMTYFQPLAILNSGDMKWKKFFYRKLCEREGLSICRTPSCSECHDYDLCFGPEDATTKGMFAHSKA